MKRCFKKTVATMLASAVMMTTALQGNIQPIFAAGTDVSTQIMTDMVYDDGGVDSDSFFFMSGGNFGEDVSEAAVLTLMDADGNKTTIPSRNADGTRKFTKVVKAISGQFYNMVQLYNGSKSTVMNNDGSYFAGSETYYDYVKVISEDVIVVGELTENNTANQKLYNIYIVTSAGEKEAIGTVRGSYSGARYDDDKIYLPALNDQPLTGGIVDFITEINLTVVYDMATGQLSKIEGDAKPTGAGYYQVRSGSATALYNAAGVKLCDFAEGMKSVDTSVLDTAGYMSVEYYSDGVSTNKLLAADGSDWINSDTDYCDISVLDSSSKIYLGTTEIKDEKNRRTNYSYIKSADNSINVDIEEDIKRIGAESGYTTPSGLFYTFNSDIVLNVKDLDNSNSGKVYVYQNNKSYANPIVLEGNSIDNGCFNTSAGYMLTKDRTYGDDGKLSIQITGLYNSDYEEVAYQGDNDLDIDGSTDSIASNDKFIFYVAIGTYRSLMDKSGQLTGQYSVVYGSGQEHRNDMVNTVREKYIAGVNGEYDRENKCYSSADVYNSSGELIISGIENFSALRAEYDYVIVHQAHNAYKICDKDGNILLTDKEYSLYDWYTDKDMNILACVYKTEEDGTKKYGAIKLIIPQIDVNKNGVFIEDGKINYYEKGIVSTTYTGIGIEAATGKRYFFDNGTAASNKEVYDAATDAWYWIDEDGSVAVNKDAFVPTNADRTEGKWVRYDENGKMIKGEDYRNGGWYWFDPITGEMLKGYREITMADGNKKYVYYDDVNGQMVYDERETDGIAYKFNEGTGEGYNGWADANGRQVWYENGVRQGYKGNDITYRGKEIYDAVSDAWYWLDNVEGGAKAVNKDVYQESYAGIYADREDGTGKWVRYDADGHMIKGWSEQNGNTYYFDMETGAMAKGPANIDGQQYYFDVNTGARQ